VPAQNTGEPVGSDSNAPAANATPPAAVATIPTTNAAMFGSSMVSVVARCSIESRVWQICGSMKRRRPASVTTTRGAPEVTESRTITWEVAPGRTTSTVETTWQPARTTGTSARMRLRTYTRCVARDISLAGHPGLALRPRGAKAVLVLAHGAGAGMRHAWMERLAEALAERAIATVRFEFPYMVAGKARVDPAPIAEACVRDVWRAATAKERLPCFAGGKSFGGRMTTRAHAAEALPRCEGIVLFGFPLHPANKPAIERAEHLVHATGKLVFISGDRDDLAELTLLRPEIAKLGPRAELHVVERADHGFTRKGDVDAVATIAARWMLRG